MSRAAPAARVSVLYQHIYPPVQGAAIWIVAAIRKSVGRKRLRLAIALDEEAVWEYTVKYQLPRYRFGPFPTAGVCRVGRWRGGLG